MVILHSKITDKNQFRFEMVTTAEVTEVIKQGVIINNLRAKVDSLAMYVEELMKFGPLKPEDVRGLKDTENLDENIEEKYRAKKIPMPPKVGTKYNEDKSNQRTGWVLEDELTGKIMEAVKEAKDYISTAYTEKRKISKVEDLKRLLDLLYGGIMIGYPAYHGLGDWEPCKVLLEDKRDILTIDDPQQDFFQFDTTLMWYAGKELERGKLLCDYIGKNEKTTIVTKFSKKGTGAPVREPLIDKETHSKMLSYYFKKQEEEKKIENETEDSYLDSQWADPKGMQKGLYTKGDITWKYK